MDINKKIGSCGLACMLCSEKLKGNCEGCMTTKATDCSIKSCCIRLGLIGCYECDEFPCEKDMFRNKRVSAFVKCAKDLGVENLVTHLQRNTEDGIKYHTEDGAKGDYDILENEDDIINLIKRGR